MPKLIWGSEQSFIAPTGDISIRTNDPLCTPFIALSHEIAHSKLGHQEHTYGISAEIDAWELTIFQLMQSGEWDEAAKEEAIFCMNSYVGDRKESEWWVNRMEMHAKSKLRYIEEEG